MAVTALNAPISDEEIRKKGFDLYCTDGAVRRITENISVIKADLEGCRIVEFKDGKWLCDCYNYTNNSAAAFCEHIYASQLARKAQRSFETEVKQEDETHLVCRYCRSPDISRCGFRYNSRGISRRYKCNDCQRKFSVVHVERDPKAKPSDMVWLLDEIGLVSTKLTELLSQLNLKIEALNESAAIASGQML
jgi:hypothetical protein